MGGLCFAYYCSGHGKPSEKLIIVRAVRSNRINWQVMLTQRVSLLLLVIFSTLKPRQTVYIVSSAPKDVFSDSISLGAMYCCAEIDPVIVQPLA